MGFAALKLGKLRGRIGDIPWPVQRRDKPGLSRGIRPVIIPAPSADFGFNLKGSARASRAIRHAPASNIFPRTFATRRREPHARRVLPLRHDETPNFHSFRLKQKWDKSLGA